MKKSNFSKNEYEYLTNSKKIELQYKMNYIYQIRHMIQKKLQWMVEDINLALTFNKKHRSKLMSHGVLGHQDPFMKIVESTLKNKKYLIREVLQIPKLAETTHVGVYENSNSNLEKFIFDAYKNYRKLGIQTLERILKRLKKG